MKASALILKLQEMVAKQGDLEVGEWVTIDEDTYIDTVEDVKYDSEESCYILEF